MIYQGKKRIRAAAFGMRRTTCPLCLSTFNHYSSLPVKDIAEVLDRSIS